MLPFKSLNAVVACSKYQHAADAVYVLVESAPLWSAAGCGTERDHGYRSENRAKDFLY